MGAWLNHTTNVIKNATHVRCRVLILLLEKFRTLRFSEDITASPSMIKNVLAAFYLK